MYKYANLVPELDAIEAFGFWLKHSKLGWSISRPAVERLESGERYPTFALYLDGVSVGIYQTPIDALAKVNDSNLTQEYLSIISGEDEPPLSQTH